MVVFLKNILRSIQKNWLSVFSLIFFISIISMVFSAANNLINNINSSATNLNKQSNLHNAIINPSYTIGDADYTADKNIRYNSRVVPAISSTAARIYQKVGDNWVLGSPVIISNTDLTAPSCFELGSQFSTPSTIYNFTNPNAIELNSDGSLKSQKITVTSQCGFNGSVGETEVLSASSPSGSSVVGYNYIKGIFNKDKFKRVNEIPIYEASSGDPFLTPFNVAGSTSSTDKTQSDYIVVAKQINEAVDNLNPSTKDNKTTWTKGFGFFYNYFKNPQPNQPTFDLSALDAIEANNYLNTIKSALSVDNINSGNLVNLINSSLEKHKLAVSTDLSKTNKKTIDDNKIIFDVNKFIQIIYKTIFYQWKTDNKTIADAINVLKASDFAKLKEYFKEDSASVLKTETKSTENLVHNFIFTATEPNIKKGFISFINKIEIKEKISIFDDALKNINTSIQTNNNSISRSQISLIEKFIISHKMWTVNNVLTNFGFTNPEDKKKTKYNLASNNIKTILFNDTTAADSNNPDKLLSVSYKIIQTTPQPYDNFVDKLTIFIGNDLYQNPSYSNYEILQRWLQLRKVRKDLTPSQNIPFIQMLLRAKYSSNRIHDVFEKYLKNLSGETDVFLTPQDRTAIKDYLNQIQDGFWSYNGYQLQFHFTSVDFFRPLSTIEAQLQKITQVPAPAYLTDTSADFIVVSPEFAQHFNKEPINDQTYEAFKLSLNSQDINQVQWETQIQNFVVNPQNAKHVLKAGGTTSIIVGTGLSADFAFPSLSLFNIIPDPTKEGLLYTNPNGYHKLLANNPSSFLENYIGIAFPKSILQAGLGNEFFKQLQTAVNQFSNSPIFFSPTDTSTTFSASGYRVVFVENIISILNLVSYLLIGIVVALTLFGVVVLIRRYSKNNSKVFGNLGANGISKFTMIVSSFLFIVIPAIVGPIIGYFIGLFTQQILFGVLNNYWFLQPEFTQFSFLTLVYYILIPVAILGIVAVVAAAITLRASSLVLMRENPIFKQNRFSIKIDNLFNKFTPLWKFRLIVATNSLPRIALLSGMSGLMIIVLLFVFSNIGQFSKIAQNEIATKKYGYAIQYRTPNGQALQTPLLSYSQLGQTYKNSITQKQTAVYRAPGSSFAKTDFNVSPQNPLLVASNINNFFQDASKKFEDNFNFQLSSNPVSALNNLNANVHLKLDQPNIWSQNSILSNFLLRSNWNSTKKQFESVKLPTPTELKQNLFYYSSDQFNPFASTNDSIANDNRNVNVINVRQLQQQAKLFLPKVKTDFTTLTPTTSAPTDKDDFYYADYVPVSQEDRDSSNGNKLILAPDGKPLFAPLANLYKTKEPLLKNNNSTSQYISYTTSNASEYNSGLKTLNTDFQEFKYGKDNQESIKLPLLNRLYRDNANYWVFSIDDRDSLRNNLAFLKNRVLVKLLLDNTINISDFGLKLKINTWDIIAPSISAVSPAIVNAIDKNHIKLIRNIIQSRYGPYFINRFFSMHKLNENITNFNDGDSFDGKTSFLIQPSDLTSTNFKANDKDNTIIPGLYYLDSLKTIYLYLNPFSENNTNAPDKRYSVFALFRPDFLYFVFSILNDPQFNTPETGPSKLVFGDQVLNPNYENSKIQWITSGVVSDDAQKGIGLTTSVPNFDIQNYNKTVNGDQTFTYLNGKFDNISEKSLIYGLKQDQRGNYVHLSHDNKSINNLLYSRVEIDNTSKKPIYPIIINQFTARKYNLAIGNVISYKLENSTNRFIEKIENQNLINDILFKVVGINDTYYQTAFYISQQNANEIIGLNPDYGYNGLFTKEFEANQQPLQFQNAVSIYSDANIYAPIQLDTASAAARELFLKPQINNNDISIPSNLEYLRLKYNISPKLTDINEVINSFKFAYGTSPLNPAINSVDNSAITNNLFDKLSNTIQALIIIILIVFIPLLVIMVMMVTSLVIDDLRQLSVIMIMLGFNNWENSVTVLTYLLPVLIIALVIGFPLGTTFLNVYVSVLLNSISILLPIQYLAWYFLSSIGILLSIFTVAFLQSYIKLKKIFLPIAMKSFED